MALKVIKSVFTLIGVILLIVSFMLQSNTRKFLNIAVEASGTVIDMHVVQDSTVSYYPIVSFTTETGEKFEFKSSVGSNPPSYNIGEEVEVLYDTSKPGKARINSFTSLWLGAIISGALGAIFFLVGFSMILHGLLANKKAAELKAAGMPVKTKLKEINLNRAVEVNGRNPYVLYTEPVNSGETELLSFKSGNIWYNPSDLIGEQEIIVYIDRKNPKRYWMDTTFLPEKR